MASIKQLPSGKWRAQIRVKGHKPVSVTRRTKAMVVAAATKIEDDLRHGRYFANDATSLETVLEWFVKDLSASKAEHSKSREESRKGILLESPALSRHTLTSLSPDAVLAYVSERSKRGTTSGTINRDLCVLSRAVESYAAVHKITLPHGNPVKTVRDALKHTRSLKPGKQRDRRFKPGEEDRLRAVMTDHMNLVLTVLIETGMRRGELCNMRWEDIRKNTLHIPAHKTEGYMAEERYIPLSPTASEALKEFERREDGFVVGMKPDSVTQNFNRACARAGIVDLRLHDCRHEALSRWAERGLTSFELQQISGHRSSAMLDRYVNLNAEDVAVRLQEAAENPRTLQPQKRDKS